MTLKKSTAKNYVIHVRVDSETLNLIRELSIIHDRTQASLINHLIKANAIKYGLLKAASPARLVDNADEVY